MPGASPRRPRLETSPRSWIVDGYNVLRVSLSPQGAENWWREERRAALLTLASRLPYPNEPITLVFDAKHLTEPQLKPAAEDARARVRQVYAPSADEWIIATLKQRSDLEQTVVVTADRPLADRARHRGAEIVATDAFVALCGGIGD